MDKHMAFVLGVMAEAMQKDQGREVAQASSMVFLAAQVSAVRLSNDWKVLEQQATDMVAEQYRGDGSPTPMTDYLIERVSKCSARGCTAWEAPNCRGYCEQHAWERD